MLDKRTRCPYYGGMTTSTKGSAMQTAKTTAFEHKPCGRCGGSGHYSYCQTHGTMCFGCSGTGYQLTKRGAAAARVFADSLCVPACAITPGMLIRTKGIPGFEGAKWMRVESVDANHVSCWRITKDEDGNEQREPQVSVLISGQIRKPGSDWSSTEDYGYGVPPTDLVRVEQSAADKKIKLADALAYQATLTQQGSPRKRTAAEVSHDANLKARAEGRPVSS